MAHLAVMIKIFTVGVFVEEMVFFSIKTITNFSDVFFGALHHFIF